MLHIRPRTARLLLVSVVWCVLGALVLAQMQGRGRRFRGYEAEMVRTPRELDRAGLTPEWKYDPEFAKDVFTFARVRYGSSFRRGGRGGWTTDTPDADLNLSYRLQQMTSLKTDPDGRFISILEKDLKQHPFLYVVEPGGLEWMDDEVPVLRDYLLNGGFLLADDFWGEAEWENFENEMARVLPERRFVELELSHPIYNVVFPINAKLQIPSIHTPWWQGITWERHDGREVHHRAIFDDRGRIMVIAFHNTDNGDGWEREGENKDYFREFAEKIAYPMGINTIFYAMTH